MLSFVWLLLQVLSEFTHGKQEKVSKTEFKEVLSDFLLGMAAGLKRDPIVILRIDGEDLLEFVNGPSFESEMVSIYSQIEVPDGSVRHYIVKALEKLTVEQGMPPCCDSWVIDFLFWCSLHPMFSFVLFLSCEVQPSKKLKWQK